MQIVFNIAEDSNVELVKGEYELVQGECCVTELKFNFPATIKGVAIGNYKKRIEFGECKELGECVKFVDDINGDTYELDDECTAFNKIMVQVVLTYNKIKWKTIPVALEFHESVNAEGNTVIQAQILSLQKIEREWENYIKSNTLRMIHKAGDVPTADAASLGDTIFYLGANTDTAPYLTYGHYYKCNLVRGVYEWTDLTQAPNLAGVADGVREINKNQTLQFWKGTTEELENEVLQENVGYIAEDLDMEAIFSHEFATRQCAEAQMAEQAGLAFNLIPRLEVVLTTKNGEFTNVPKFHDGAIYLVVYKKNAQVIYGGEEVIRKDMATCIFVANKDVEQSIPLRVGVVAAESEWFTYTPDENKINVTLGNLGVGGNEPLNDDANKLLFYRIGSAYNNGISIYLGGELSAANGYKRIELRTLGSAHLGVGVKLAYGGEIAQVVDYDANDKMYTLLCEENGAFDMCERNTVIDVEVVA